MQPLEGAGNIVVYEFQRPPPLTQSATQDSPYKKDVLPIFGCPVSNCVSQMGSQKSLNVSCFFSGQFELSLLLTRAGNGSCSGCLGACREGRGKRVWGLGGLREAPPDSVHLHLQLSPQPASAACSKSWRTWSSPDGKLMASSRAAEPALPLGAWGHSE